MPLRDLKRWLIRSSIEPLSEDNSLKRITLLPTCGSDLKKKKKSLTDKMDAFVFSQVSDEEQKASDLTNNNMPNNGQMLGSADVLGLNISPTFSLASPGAR